MLLAGALYRDVTEKERKDMCGNLHCFGAVFDKVNKMLPSSKLKNDLRNKWRPILTKMMQAPGLIVDDDFVPDEHVFGQSLIQLFVYTRH